MGGGGFLNLASNFFQKWLYRRSHFHRQNFFFFYQSLFSSEFNRKKKYQSLSPPEFNQKNTERERERERMRKRNFLKQKFKPPRPCPCPCPCPCPYPSDSPFHSLPPVGTSDVPNYDVPNYDVPKIKNLENFWKILGRHSLTHSQICLFCLLACLQAAKKAKKSCKREKIEIIKCELEWHLKRQKFPSLKCESE